MNLDVINLILRILLMPIAFFVGGFQSRRHERSLEQREGQLNDILVTNLKRVASPQTVARATMVVGHVVIATDYYKSFATSLRNFIGGEMKNAISLCTRARREALVRLREEARRVGATEVWNVRYTFTNIAGTAGGAAMQIELLAYGTAVVRGA